MMSRVMLLLRLLLVTAFVRFEVFFLCCVLICHRFIDSVFLLAASKGISISLNYCYCYCECMRMYVCLFVAQGLGAC